MSFLWTLSSWSLLSWLTFFAWHVYLKLDWNLHKRIKRFLEKLQRAAQVGCSSGLGRRLSWKCLSHLWCLRGRLLPLSPPNGNVTTTTKTKMISLVFTFLQRSSRSMQLTGVDWGRWQACDYAEKPWLCWGWSVLYPGHVCLTHHSLILVLKVGSGLGGHLLMTACLMWSFQWPCCNPPRSRIIVCRQSRQYLVAADLLCWPRIFMRSNETKEGGDNVWKLLWIRKPGPLNSVMKPYSLQRLKLKTRHDYLLVHRNGTIYQANQKPIVQI